MTTHYPSLRGRIAAVAIQESQHKQNYEYLLKNFGTSEQALDQPVRIKNRYGNDDHVLVKHKI
jgi:hypothetical protein